MPSGTYAIFDEAGTQIGEETFRTAPGIAGSRYFATARLSSPKIHDAIVDVSTDIAWHPVRIRMDTGGHHLLLQRSDEGFIGSHDGQQIEHGPAEDFDYPSPTFTAATIDRIALRDEPFVEVAPVRITAFTLTLMSVRHRYERLGDEAVATPVGSFAATHWKRSGDGPDVDIWVAGDLVVAATGRYVLTAYDPGVGPVPS